MTLEEVISVIRRAEEAGKMTVRLHTGDPSIYGAIREQMDLLEELGISYDVCPGVSSFCGAAASLNMEFTLPGGVPDADYHPAGRADAGSGSGRACGSWRSTRRPWPFSERRDDEAAFRGADGRGISADTPAALVYKATWPTRRKFSAPWGLWPEGGRGGAYEDHDDSHWRRGGPRGL